MWTVLSVKLHYMPRCYVGADIVNERHRNRVTADVQCGLPLKIQAVVRFGMDKQHTHQQCNSNNQRALTPLVATRRVDEMVTIAKLDHTYVYVCTYTGVSDGDCVSNC